jgi:hypothetical protein
VTLTLYSDNISTEATLGGSLPNPSNACTGAFLLVAYDPGNTTVNRAAGTLTGQILKLGTDRTGNGTDFLLQPGMDLTNFNNDNFEYGASPGTMTCYIIGRAPGLTSSAANNYIYGNAADQGNFIGPNQDIAAMSAYITVNTATN